MGMGRSADDNFKDCIKQLIAIINEDSQREDHEHIRTLTEMKEGDKSVTDAEIAVLSKIKLADLYYAPIENSPDEIILASNKDEGLYFVASDRSGNSEFRGQKLREILNQAKEKDPTMSVYSAIISASKKPANNSLVIYAISACLSSIESEKERELAKEAMMLTAHIIYHQINTGTLYDANNSAHLEQLFDTYQACEKLCACLSSNTVKNKFIDHIKNDTSSFIRGDITFDEMRNRCADHVKAMTKHDKLIAVCVTIANLVMSLFMGIGSQLYLYATQKRGFFEDPNKENKKDLTNFVIKTSSSQYKK